MISCKKHIKPPKKRRQRPQMAYILCEQGVLAEAQGDWANAQKYYEQALETARTSRAPGAEGRAMGNLADVYCMTECQLCYLSAA